MCGGSGGTGKGKNSASSNFGGYSFGKGLGSIADQRRGENRDAMGRGSNISNGPTNSNTVAATKQTLGAPEPQPVQPKQEMLTKHPVPMTTRLTGVFGPMGINAIKETEEAFTARSLFGTKRGEITVPDNFGWDFEKSKPVGKSPSWTPNRTEGSIRDKFMGMIGQGYDRAVTPNRAKDMLSRGPGVLSTWTECLEEGNYQYDEQGLPAPDKVGLAYDFLKPLFGLVTQGPISGLLNGVNAVDTAMDHTRLTKAGVFGKQSQTIASNRSPRHAPITSPGSTGAVAAMLGNDESPKNNPSFLTASRATNRITAPKAKEASGKREAKPVAPRTRQSLLLTGSQGLQTQPSLMLRALFGK